MYILTTSVHQHEVYFTHFLSLFCFSYNDRVGWGYSEQVCEKWHVHSSMSKLCSLFHIDRYIETFYHHMPGDLA